MLEVNTKILLSRVFRAYYLRGFAENTIPAPTKLTNREFAFTFWDTPGMSRHIKLKNILELRDIVLKGASFQNIYMSGAYYQYPNASVMINKNWFGTDFLIDIDADHLTTPCKKEHDYWICECGEKGRGTPPSACKKCGGQKFTIFTWICDECLNEAKSEILKVLDEFFPTFNIDVADAEVHFSGNRGYHLIIHDDRFIHLSDFERREIVDYLTRKIGIHLDPPVSFDLHRLIRFANSIHSKTGLKVVNIPIEHLEKFDPFSEAVAFGFNAIEKILIKYDVPSFRIGNTTYGPYTPQTIIAVPLPVAVFLLCKEVAAYL
jgi:DNA primase catalytic subunit